MRFFLFSFLIATLNFFSVSSQAALYSVDHMVLMDDQGILKATATEIRESLRELAWSDADIKTFLNLRSSDDRLNFSKGRKSGKPAKSLVQFDDE